MAVLSETMTLAISANTTGFINSLGSFFAQLKIRILRIKSKSKILQKSYLKQ